MYETFEHTADVGLRIRAATLERLLADAAQGLYSLIVPDARSVRLTAEHRIELAFDSPDLLLFDWLSELLFVYETRHLLLAEFEIELAEKRFTAICRGESFDPARHVLDHEVKAITYHGLRVEQQADGSWLAEVIVDI